MARIMTLQELMAELDLSAEQVNELIRQRTLPGHSVSDTLWWADPIEWEAFLSTDDQEEEIDWSAYLAEPDRES